jgi:phosphatidylethanolamine-binding protein (PEBP) family uncharacterized protein
MQRLVVALALAAAACSSIGAPGDTGDDGRKLAVDFSWNGVEACSNVSPKITVYNAPAGTRRFRVELVDLDSAISRHGGGEVEAGRDGVIPAGALKSYRGPCPGQNPINYEMRVAALDASGQVLARGAERQTFTVKSLIRRR